MYLNKNSLKWVQTNFTCGLDDPTAFVVKGEWVLCSAERLAFQIYGSVPITERS